jgi:hypothetical protein
MVANVEPFSVGTIEAEFDRLMTSKMDKREIQVIFHPRLNEVALEFRYQFITFRQFWNEANRKKFAASLERYKEDYAARKLGTSYTRSKAAYGRVDAHLEWQTAKYTQVYVAYPTIEIGYRFRNETPFFATLMRGAREVPQGRGADTNLMESAQLNVYFTRAQADELVSLFDQHYLMELLSRVGSRSNEPLAPDAYNEFDDGIISEDVDISDDY